MKSISFIAFACFIPIILTAPVNDGSSGLTDADIREISNSLTVIKGLNSETRDNFMEVIKKFRKDVSYDILAEGVLELFSLAVQSDVGDVDITVFKQYLNKSSSSEDIEKTFLQDGLTEEELKLLEDDLSKQLTPAQTQHAMSILRGLREGASSREREISLYDLFVSALNTMINESSK